MAYDPQKIAADISKTEQALRQTFLSVEAQREVLVAIFHGAYKA